MMKLEDKKTGRIKNDEAPGWCQLEFEPQRVGKIPGCTKQILSDTQRHRALVVS